MTTEIKRKNTDYSNSAVKMCNPATIQTALHGLALLESELASIQEEIKNYIPAELMNQEAGVQMAIESTKNLIKGMIDSDGSYQDLSAGWYAVKQRKVSRSYNPTAFERNYPEFASAVIVKAVDTVKLNGLIKGGLLNEDNLKNPDVGVITETESYSYIIKV